MKINFNPSFKCQGGYAVYNPNDAHPNLCGVNTETLRAIPLMKSEDYGETWKVIGHFRRNLRGGFSLKLHQESHSE